MATTKELANLKQFLLANPENIRRNYQEVVGKLKAELAIIQAEGNTVIPEVRFEDVQGIGGFSAEIRKQIRRRGVVIVRNVFDSSTAERILTDLKAYMKLNGEDPDDPASTFFEIYWSKAQIEARQHPNMVNLQKKLLSLWKTNPELDSQVDLDQPLMYIDRFRMRKPGDDKFQLNPHLDSGMLSRWLDPIYRESYKHIINGNWKDHDPFVVNGRGQVKMDRHSSFFRAFQGWTSLTESQPGSGTLKVCPILKETIAYLMLRPLMEDVPMDEFPGFAPGKIFYLDPKYHDVLFEHLLSIPEVKPGDSVWWHPDLIHSVEKLHGGKQINTVMCTSRWGRIAS